MMTDILSVVLLLSACFWIWFGTRRSSRNVLDALRESEVQQESKNPKLYVAGDTELLKAGIKNLDEQKILHKKLSLIPFALPAGIVVLRILFGMIGTEGTVISIILGFSIGVLLKGRIITRLQKKYVESIKYYLPLAMERMVMAVEAGLDLVPAMISLSSLEDKLGDPKDPTMKIFKQVVDLSESGIRFDEALEHVAQQTNATPLKHAFVHLGVAFREGGEVIGPLRELSDATQLQYQEEIEENIAKLPVKATMPLMLMFLGMLLCFLTPPAVQVISVAGEMSAGMKQGSDRTSFSQSKGER